MNIKKKKEDEEIEKVCFDDKPNDVVDEGDLMGNELLLTQIPPAENIFLWGEKISSTVTR